MLTNDSRPGLGPVDPARAFGFATFIKRRGTGDNYLRTLRFSQPMALRTDDILATGDRVLSPPQYGPSGVIWLHLSSGQKGQWVRVPSRIPIALMVIENKEPKPAKPAC